MAPRPVTGEPLVGPVEQRRREGAPRASSARWPRARSTSLLIVIGDLAGAHDRPVLHVAAAGAAIASRGLVERHHAPAAWRRWRTTADFADQTITGALVTTVWIAIGATILPIIVAALAGYAFAWMDFPGRDWLFIGVIGMLVVPLQMALIPIFSLYNHLHLFDTVPGLILFHTAFGLPFAIFLLRNFFVGIPKEMLEAARIDGASEISIFRAWCCR